MGTGGWVAGVLWGALGGKMNFIDAKNPTFWAQKFWINYAK